MVIVRGKREDLSRGSHSRKRSLDLIVICYKSINSFH